MSKKKLIILTSIAVVVVAALVAAIFFVNGNRKSPTQKIEESKTYSLVEGVTTIAGMKPSSIVIAPATQQWWEKLALFSSDVTIADFDYESISSNATYIAYTNSPGLEYTSYDTLGMSTTFVIYKTADDARKAGNAVGDTRPYFVRANLLLFLPAGAFSDVDYALNQFTNSKEVITTSDLALGNKAVLQVNFDDFTKQYTKGMSDPDVKTYKHTMSLLGVQKESGWIGYSTDGMSWDGKFYNMDMASVKKPTEIMGYLAKQIAYVKQDGTIGYGAGSVAEADQTGIILTRQSILNNYMRISDNTETSGEFLEGDPVQRQSAEVLKKSEGLMKIEIDINPWLAFMRGGEVSYPFTGFDKVTVLVTATDGSSTVQFTELPPVEQ